jgi:hypothetical protein
VVITVHLRNNSTILSKNSSNKVTTEVRHQVNKAITVLLQVKVVILSRECTTDLLLVVPRVVISVIEGWVEVLSRQDYALVCVLHFVSSIYVCFVKELGIDLALGRVCRWIGSEFGILGKHHS